MGRCFCGLENRVAMFVDEVPAIQDDDVKVNVEIERGIEALNESDGAAMQLRVCISIIRKNRMDESSQNCGHDSWLRSEEKS